MKKNYTTPIVKKIDSIVNKTLGNKPAGTADGQDTSRDNYRS